MPNREPPRARSTHARRGGDSDAGTWVVVAFCAVGFAATVFFVFLSSQVANALVG